MADSANVRGDSGRGVSAPTGMLALLVIAFGGSLALKAWEEHRTAETAVAIRHQREATAVAGQVHAELVSSRARMEGMLLAGATLEAIRRGGEFDAVSMRDPTDGAWAALSDEGGVRVFARAPDGRWASGLKASAALLPSPQNGLTAELAPVDEARLRTTFSGFAQDRVISACASIGGSGIAACVTHPAPLFTLDDANRVFIYLLLLAAPLLAVVGLLGVIRRQRLALETAEAGKMSTTPTEEEAIAAFEVPGLIGMWRWNPEAQLITVGPEAARLVGVARSGEMSLDEFVAVTAEDDRRRILHALEGAEPTQSISVTFQGSGATAGRYFDLLGGAHGPRYAGAVLNVTDRIQAQHRSRRAEALARTALDAHPGPFAVWDSRKRLTHWNASFVRTFNLDPAVAQVGASYDYVMTEATKFIRLERPLGDDANGREMLLLSEQWIRLVDRRTSNDGLISVGIDITALKRHETGLSRSERHLRAMVTELERARGQADELAARFAEQKATAVAALSSKTIFLNAMSHELRTPLNAINGFSEMIANQIYGPVGDDRYREYAATILEAGQHLLDIINDILDMAKIEAGKMEISPRPIDPSDAVDAAIRLIRRKAMDKDIAINLDADDDLPEINGDHRAIKQMTLNLLANAIKFTEPGGEILVQIATEQEWLIIRVVDTGIGISADDLPRLGRPFEQAPGRDSQTRTGTGLGLALTKSFAEMHGGRLAIESTVGVGTTVTIWLPLPSGQTATSPVAASIAS